MLDLAGADAVRQRAEGAVGRGVAVAADDRHARQREALLRPDDVDDALAAVELVVILDAEFARVLGQLLDLQPALGIGDALAAVGGLHVVVDDGERLVRRAHLAAGQAQALERLRARHLVDEVAVDVEEGVPSASVSMTWSSQILSYSVRGLAMKRSSALDGAPVARPGARRAF